MAMGNETWANSCNMTPAAGAVVIHRNPRRCLPDLNQPPPPLDLNQLPPPDLSHSEQEEYEESCGSTSSVNSPREIEEGEALWKKIANWLWRFKNYN